jgi:dephospho-CoA kinase
MVIGLTGGIGCGKSTAAGFFRSHGFVVIDSDVLAHQALNESKTLTQLKSHWGSACIQNDGTADRDWIGKKVFSEPAEKVFLESITHPRIAALRQETMADSSKSYILEIPLLFELGLTQGVNAIVCVASSDDVRLKRLESRGMNRMEAQKRINSQMPISEKVKKSNYVIWNDGSLEFLKAEVDKCVQTLKA